MLDVCNSFYASQLCAIFYNILYRRQKEKVAEEVFITLSVRSTIEHKKLQNHSLQDIDDNKTDITVIRYGGNPYLILRVIMIMLSFPCTHTHTTGMLLARTRTTAYTTPIIHRRTHTHLEKYQSNREPCTMIAMISPCNVFRFGLGSPLYAQQQSQRAVRTWSSLGDSASARESSIYQSISIYFLSTTLHMHSSDCADTHTQVFTM